MTQYTEFIKQYADDNALSYKQAMKEVKEKDVYQQYKNKLTRTMDISLDTEVEPPVPEKKKEKKLAPEKRQSAKKFPTKNLQKKNQPKK